MITKKFKYTGKFQLWQVPANVDTATALRWVLEGPTGGPVLTGGGGGYDCPPDGDHVEGDRTPVPSQNWYVAVGQGGSTDRAGWNGGGLGDGAPGGGGATDIRVGDTTLASRVAVAAASGGGLSTSGSGGDGGNATTSAGGTGGAAAAGGVNGSAGTLGKGGPGAYQSGGPYGGSSGGGGGGGLYGGGGGAAKSAAAVNYGMGGRGSSYTGGLSGVIVNTAIRPGAPFGRGNPSVANAGIDGTASVTYNLVPNAPIPLGPVGGANFDLTLPLPVSWLFSDDDPGDAQSAFELQYRANGGAWVTTGQVTASASTASIPANTFGPGDQVEYQVRTWDQSDAVSAWSASGFATACFPPATSFVFDPALTGIASRQPVVTGERSDSGPVAQWRMQVTTTAGVVLADTGVVSAPQVSVTAVSQLLPDVAYVNGESAYHVLAMIAYPAGVWQHGWTDSGALVANILAPPKPGLALVNLVDDAAVQFTITNPAPTGGGAAPVHNDLYRTEGNNSEQRIRTGLALNVTDIDDTPAGSASGLPVNYRAVAVTADGATANSD